LSPKKDEQTVGGEEEEIGHSADQGAGPGAGAGVFDEEQGFGQEADASVVVVEGGREGGWEGGKRMSKL